MSRPRWIPDSSSNRCHECRTSFSLFTRRHHCRVCGRIFCHACTSDRVNIPQTMLRTMTPPEEPKGFMQWAASLVRPTSDVVVGSPDDRGWHLEDEPVTLSEQRVCTTCKDVVVSTVSVEDLTEAILTLNVWDIRIPEWRALACVCKTWQTAMNVLIHTFVSIQHVPPYGKTTPFQKRLLWANAPLLSRHHLTWAMVAGRSGVRVRNPTYVPCRVLGCATQCQHLPSWFHSIVSLVLGDRDEMIRQLCHDPQLNMDGLFSCFGNLLAAATVHDKFLLAELIVPLCKRSSSFAHKIYFAIQARDKVLSNALRNHLEKETLKEIDKTNAWMTALVHVATKGGEVWFPPARLPTKPLVWVKKILHENVRKATSSTKPCIVPCVCINTSNQEFIQCFMVKKECLFSDACILDAMNVLHVVLSQNQVGLEHVLYDVTCVDQHTGIITIVPGARTLYSLWQQNTSLQNWVFENMYEKHKNIRVDTVKNRFLESCAFSTCASLLFGFGDRHLDNILITRKGHLFHVDFSHVLGIEPGVKSLTGNSFRITNQMVDFLGGKQSRYFALFQQKCVNVFKTAKEWYVCFYAVLMALVYDKQCTLEQVIRIIDTVYCPGVHLNVPIHIEEKIDRASSGTHWTDAMTDYFHHVFHS